MGLENLFNKSRNIDPIVPQDGDNGSEEGRANYPKSGKYIKTLSIIHFGDGHNTEI